MILYKNQNKDFNDFKLRNLDFITVNGNTCSDSGVSNNSYVCDTLDKNTSLRFVQSPQNYLKEDKRNNKRNLTLYDRSQISDSTIIIYLNRKGYL